MIQPTTNTPALMAATTTTNPNQQTIDQHPALAPQRQEQEILGETTTEGTADGCPSENPPSNTPEERENPRQQEDLVIGPTQATQPPDPAPTGTAEESTPAANPPPAEATEAPPQDQHGGEDLTPVDKLPDTVYGDHVRADDGSHQDGGVATDHTWQSYW